MTKIPVGRTIAFAYQFTLGHLGTIIGLIWLPTLLVTVAGFFIGKPYYEAMANAAGPGTLPGSMALTMLLFQAVAFAVAAMNSVAVTRTALGMRRPDTVLLHFALGPSEFRVMGVYFILFGLSLLFLIGLVLGLTILTAILSAVAGKLPGAAPIAELCILAIALAGICALVFAMIRLMFLSVPATVADEKIGIIRSWELSAGNFWRIFVVLVATLLPITLLMAAAEVMILGQDVVVPPLSALSSPEALERFSAAQMRALSDKLPLVMGLSFFASPFLYGLMFAPAAYAFRSLASPPGLPVEA